MEDDQVTWREAREHFCDPIVSVADSDSGRTGPPVFDCENDPIVTLAKQCAYRQREHTARAPNGNMDDHSIIVPQSRPRFARIAHWSGPRFFGSRKGGRSAESTEGEDAQA
jgi:hypothetical protein